MSDDRYMDSIFDVIDGKITFENLDRKKRGRRPGYRHTPETKEKIASKMTGRKKSVETRDKISKSLAGRPKPMEVRDKISVSKMDPDNVVSRDFIRQYAGVSKERDVCTCSYDWIKKHYPESLSEINTWLKDHAEELDESDDICTESVLNASAFYKEGVILEPPFEKDDWR